MLSLEECKKMLEKNGAKYTDEEVLKIRDFLYMLAKLDFALYNQRTPPKKKSKKTDTG